MSLRSRVLVACLPLSLAAGSTPAPLKFRPNVGEVHKAHVRFEMHFQGQVAKIGLEAVETVLAVAPNGNVSVEDKQINTVVATAGHSAHQPPAPASVRIYRSDHTMIPDRTPTDATRADFRTENLLAIKLPDSPLAVGKSWRWKTTPNPASGATDMNATYKVVGSENVVGFPCWKISLQSREVGSATPASATGLMWILKSNAFVIRENFTFTNFPAPGSNGTISGQTQILPYR